MSTTRSYQYRRAAIAALVIVLLAALSQSEAQVTQPTSIDPLMGTTFSTPVFTPASTFTPTSTFNMAGSRTPTAISGPGPSVTTPSYTFSYDNVLSTVPGTPLSNVYSSLAANGTPTAQTNGLAPDPTNLQLVNAGPRSHDTRASTFVAAFAALGAGIALVAMA
ncbi:unnamed protein product [Jaminaea pallidilutea]